MASGGIVNGVSGQKAQPTTPGMPAIAHRRIRKQIGTTGFEPATS